MTRIKPLRLGESNDSSVNNVLNAAKAGWFQDTKMFGVIGRNPDLLKVIVPVFETIFGKATVEPYLLELMRLKTGEKNKCAYCATVRIADFRELVELKESFVFGDSNRANLSEKEALVVELADKIVTDPNAIEDEAKDSPYGSIFEKGITYPYELEEVKS
jgi:alkylhydroperoxidase family enzyme